MSAPKPSLDDLRIARENRPGSSRFGWIGLILILLLVGVGVIYWLQKPEAVEVRTVLARELTASGSGERTVLNASGYVTARREATVSSKVTGKVVEVLIEEGMRVGAGQMLARLDDINIRASLSLAKAQLTASRSATEEIRVRIREAENNLKRIASLAKSSISAQAELDRAEAEVDSLKARLQQQESAVKVSEREVAVWEQNLEDTIIRAPFAGIVTSKNAQPGEMISPISAGGGFTRTGICTIVDMDSLEIEIDVNESYINRVQPAQAVEAALDAYPDWKIPCKVIAIIPTADRQKSTVRVRVGFDDLDKRILPQMSVKVGFRESAASASTPSALRLIVVPRSAVYAESGTDRVLVVLDGRAELRGVTVAGGMADEVQVSAGLKAGEKVIVNRPPGLVAGARVKEKKS